MRTSSTLRSALSGPVIAVAMCGCGSSPAAVSDDAAIADATSDTAETTSADTGATTVDDGGLAWKPLPGGEACGLRILVAGTLPGRPWTTLGMARSAPPALPGYTMAINSTSAGATIGKDAFLRLSMRRSGSELTQVFRVSD